MATPEESMLKILKLEDYYPQKLHYKDAIKLQGLTADDQDCNFGLMIVRKLLELDHRVLQLVTAKINKSREEATHSPSDESKEGETQKPMFTILGKKPEKSPPKVYPVDLMITVFNCCDNFLRQILVEKMFLCRLGIPVLFPLVRLNKDDKPMELMLFWGLKTIFLETKGTTSRHISRPLIDISNPIISFLRVGELHRSKSKLLNVLLNRNHHDTFYHRDCLNGSAKRIESNGTIETAWYILDGNHDFSSEFFTVLNLRGDCLLLTRQTRFMCENSSLVVVMLDSVDALKKFYDKAEKKNFNFTNTKILLAFVSKSSMVDDGNKLSEFLNSSTIHSRLIDIISDWMDEGQMMNQQEWKESIKQALNKFLGCDDKKESTLASLITGSVFKQDCDKDVWKETQAAADEVTDLMRSNHFQNSKAMLCPLQGQPWIRIGELERVQRKKREDDGSKEKFIADTADEMRKCRQNQISAICDLNEPMKRFCENFLCFDNIFLLCFLKLTKLNLDTNSRQIIPNLIQKYQEDIENYRKLHGNSGSALDEKAAAMETRLSDASLGLEHIIREMGLMYEVLEMQSSGDEDLKRIQKEQIRKFPKIVAGLFLEGIGLEIMDGDGRNIPLAWLTAVFNEVEKLIGKDKKVFVLSIIGVQSSGKSTFLNALFGLQFPVSAGRCTRGIYCHLVPIDTETFPHDCDYILVVDSEGLRAPEFAGLSIKRDNELATLTVGLADVTVVNTKGENLNDMEDILQIVVHALIRIKQTKKDLKFMPSCLFVHQNVAAADAEEKIQMGRIAQLRHLDKMAQAAAKEEEVKDVSGFKDVIKYEENLHSWYMPDLWQGQPPMATVNSEYSKKATEVKGSILRMMTEKPQRLTISQFFGRMSDLWNALLHDNFVVCFKNTQEMLAHRSLDVRITEVVWDMKNTNSRRQNVINNTVMSYESVEDLEEAAPEIESKLNGLCEDSYKKTREALDQLLNEGEYMEILEYSREQYERSFLRLIANERSRADEETRKIIEIHKLKLKNYKGATDSGIVQLVKCVEDETRASKQTSSELTPKELEAHFDEKWKEWTSKERNECQNVQKSGTDKVKQAIDEVISMLLDCALLPYHEQFKEGITVTVSYEKDPLKAMPQVSDADIIIDTKDKNSRLDGHQKSCITDANNSCREVFSFLKSYIDEERRVMNFDVELVRDIFNQIAAFFGIIGVDSNMEYFHRLSQTPRFSPSTPILHESVNSSGGGSSGGSRCHSTLGYKFNKEFIFQFLIFLGKYAFVRFNYLTQQFISKTHPMFDMENRYKSQLKVLFRYQFHQTTPEVMAGEIFANLLVNIATQTVVKDLGRLVVEKIGFSEKNEVFKSKHSFLRRILADLAKEGNFIHYIAYLETEEQYFEEKIKSLLEESLLKHTKNSSSATATSVLLEMAIKKLNDLINETKAHLNEAKESCNGSLQMLLSKFQEATKSELLFQKNDFRIIRDLDIIHLTDVFSDTLFERIEDLRREAVISYRDAKEKIWNELQRSDIDPIKELLDKILGCREKCPFCSAPCSATTQYHANSHQANHYPMGVGGTIDVSETSDVAVSGKNPLVLETCHSLVESNKEFRSQVTDKKYSRWWERLLNWNYNRYWYNRYKEFYPEWDIPVDRSMNASLYWKWFMARFSKELADHYKANAADIPQAWKDITLEEALNSLKNLN